jgi:hypothetical protein
MPSQHASGAQTATVGTEHFLGTDPDTTAGVFQFVVELVNMARGDTLEVRVYEKATGSGDTARQIQMWPITNEQTDLLFVSPALILLHGWRFSIKQTTGTSRSFKWSIRKV